MQSTQRKSSQKSKKLGRDSIDRRYSGARPVLTRAHDSDIVASGFQKNSMQTVSVIWTGVMRNRFRHAISAMVTAVVMGGLLAAQLEVVPAAGQSVVFRGLRLTAQSVDERRVLELSVEVVRKK